jgi:hypothetical protein
MKTIAFIFTLSLFQQLLAQTDTTYYTQDEFSVSLTADSCHIYKQSTSSPFNQYLVLGNPAYLCDRIYYKQGKKFDRKKSTAFGFIYVQYDSTERVRVQQVENTLYPLSLKLEITDAGRIFFSSVQSDFITRYFTLPNGSLEKVIADFTTSDEQVRKQLGDLIRTYSHQTAFLQWQQKNTQQLIEYAIYFLKTGMVERYGHYYYPSGKLGTPRKIGTWVEYQPMCDCYKEKTYFVK